MRARTIIHAVAEAESLKAFFRDQQRHDGEHAALRVYAISDSQGREYVVDGAGCITHYNWQNERQGGRYWFSGQWKVVSLELGPPHDAERVRWPALKRALDDDEVFHNCYLYDLDHDSLRRWGAKVDMHKMAPPAVEEAENLKSFLKSRKVKGPHPWAYMVYLSQPVEFSFPDGVRATTQLGPYSNTYEAARKLRLSGVPGRVMRVPGEPS